jgi:hypothetical protein
MVDIAHFMPKHQRDAEANLREFIRLCRHDLTVFGADLDWESWWWRSVVQYTKIGTHTLLSGKPAPPEQLLDPAFSDFAKAYLRYQQGHKPTKTRWESQALKALEAGLLQVNGEAGVSGISGAVLDVSAALLRDAYSPGAAYHGGRELERLAKFVSKRCLVPADVSSWRSPIARLQDTVRTGAVAAARREKKLPAPEAMDALAEIFANDPSSPKDIFTSCTFAITMAAPSRLTEVLELPVDCEHVETDRDGNMRYGLRFYSGKGYGANIKWIPTEMVPIARTAIARLRVLTEPARQLAQWIENQPDKFYRHDSCPAVADDTPLSAEQASQALGIVSLFNKGLSRRAGVHTLDSLWRVVMTELPNTFPWLSKEKGVKYSEALFAMTQNLLHASRGVSPVRLWNPDVNVFNNDLSPRESLGPSNYHKSIFDRHGFTRADGTPLKLTSYQARHLLNTIVQRGGLSQPVVVKEDVASARPLVVSFVAPV